MKEKDKFPILKLYDSDKLINICHIANGDFLPIRYGGYFQFLMLDFLGALEWKKRAEQETKFSISFSDGTEQFFYGNPTVMVHSNELALRITRVLSRREWYTFEGEKI